MNLAEHSEEGLKEAENISMKLQGDLVFTKIY